MEPMIGVNVSTVMLLSTCTTLVQIQSTVAQISGAYVVLGVWPKEQAAAHSNQHVDDEGDCKGGVGHVEQTPLRVALQFVFL